MVLISPGILLCLYSPVGQLGRLCLSWLSFLIYQGLSQLQANIAWPQMGLSDSAPHILLSSEWPTWNCSQFWSRFPGALSRKAPSPQGTSSFARCSTGECISSPITDCKGHLHSFTQDSSISKQPAQYFQISVSRQFPSCLTLIYVAAKIN